MDPSPWSPYSQQPYSHLSSGSPRSLALPPSVPREDSLNNYGSGNSHPLLLSPCQGLQPLPPRPNTADPTARPPAMLNSHYDTSLISPPVRSSKEPTEFYSENLYNGVCKENQTGIRSFIQASGLSSRNDSTGCTTSENSNSGFGSHVPPSISFHPSNIDRPSPGPFGVLPHEAVMTRPNRYDRNNDKFVSPISKPVSTPFNSGPFPDHDVNSVYNSATLSTQTAFSNDNASHSPVVNTVTSPTISNFSSPSDYYSSPKTNFGAYNSMQSPMPQSPSVAQQSYPSSPFTNVDPVSHISSAPPCSPMSSGTYINNLSERGVIVSQVPQRNGQKSQHSPSNTAGGNGVICYNPQPSQSIVHHGHQSAVSKTPDYHSDYGVFSHDHNLSPSSYSSVYSNIHSTTMASGDNAAMPPRSHGQLPNLPHDNRLSYTHPSPLPPSTISSPTYLQNKTVSAHDMVFGSCSSSVPTGQSMLPSRYENCPSVIDPLRNRPMHHNTTSMMPPHMGNDRQFSYQPSDMNDDKNALDMFNSHVDSGVHNPDNCQSSISNFLESELPILETDVLTNRQLRISEPSHPPQQSAMDIENTSGAIMAHAQMTNVQNNNELPVKNNIPYPYDTNLDLSRSGTFTFNSLPRKRGGRRGRRRRSSEVNSGSRHYQYQSYKNERNVIFNNGYPLNHKAPDYRSNNDCYSNYPKTYKEGGFNANEFHSTPYVPSKYLLQKKKEETVSQNCTKIPFLDRKRFQSIEEELGFLGKLIFPDEDTKDSPHTFMKTRNKDCEGFLQCYKNFLEIRKTSPDEEPEPPTAQKDNNVGTEHKEKRVSKFIIRMGRCNNPGEWRLTETLVSPERFSESNDESASMDSNANMSSHKVQEDKSSDDKSRLRAGNTGNLNSVSERLSRNNSKRNFESVARFDKYSDHAGSHFTNSETLPAGKTKAKSGNGEDCAMRVSSTVSNQKTHTPRKRGRKAKNPSTVQTPVKQKARRSSVKVKVEEPLKELPHPIKQEVISDEDSKPVILATRRSSLRSRREDLVLKEEPQPGPSIKIESVELSSDDIDVIDDSDSDPAWTPSARAPKISEPIKSHHIADPPIKKRRRKRSRKNSSSSNAAATRKRKENAGESARKKVMKVQVKNTTANAKKEKLCETDFIVKKEKKCDFFVMSKADTAKEKPPIWRVDTDMNMLQRFDFFDEQGLHLHRNTYTYAAWNDATEAHYIRVKVKVLSCSRMMYVVQYLGLEPPPPNQNNSSPVASLRDNFEVFLQTLISQALDPNFLSEITKEKDEYFLGNIRGIENITEDKKNSLVKATWDQELRKCAEVYPCVNILPAIDSGDRKCQVCSSAKSEKLVQFYGPPYDWTTFGSMEAPLSNKTQFNVCAICSATVSLYSRLHHQKYNFFIKCRSKMNHVKGDNESMESHVLLDNCLRDLSWVNLLYRELEDIWQECDRRS